jgi:hypothetical protein
MRKTGLSAGFRCTPYKQEVGGSIPSSPIFGKPRKSVALAWQQDGNGSERAQEEKDRRGREV